jgi:ribonuclease P protein component
MLPAERRVRRREEFAATVRHGQRIGARALVVHVLTTTDEGPARAGFIVGRAVGPAVTRNRIRRQLRHLMAPRLNALPAGTAVVVRVTPAAVGQSRRALATALDTVLDRAAAAI